MCGIMAFRGLGDAAALVRDGLARLEYRGYDSWGIAAWRDGVLRYAKDVGRLGTVPPEMLGAGGVSSAIGHVRWATHGGVTRANAHPHFSTCGRVAVVHNGIIENYQHLRRELRAEGVAFVSETDTEVIPHLVARELAAGHGFVEAVRRGLAHCEGAFAVAALDRDSGLLVGARRFSPLVLGVGEDACYLASDVPAFLAQTRQAVFLEEDDLVILGGGGPSDYEVRDLVTGEPRQRASVRVEWDVEQAERGGHPHFTIKEILEQPDALTRVAATSERELLEAAEMLKRARAIHVTACGTAFHAGLFGAYLFSTRNGLAVHPISAGEFPYFAGLLREGDVMIAISQSGETADLMAAVRTARAAGVRVLSIVNVMGSSLMRASDRSLLTKAGPEIGVVSTKAYLTQLAMLTLLSHAIEGDLAGGRRVLEEVKAEVERIVASPEAHQALAPEIARCPCIYAIGRGVDYPSALEWCLKIKEISYIHAEGMAAGDLKHGPLALVEPGIPLFALASDSASAKDTLSNAIEAKARGATLIGIGAEPNEVFDHFFPVEARGPFAALPAIVHGQLLAYYIALAKGLDPDKPRNLAKSVTVR